jgi:hypothetical protein
MSHDIYQILENLDAAQRSVKQLPALFKPKDTSPQLSGPYPGVNATLGYLVGEDEDMDGDERKQLLTKFKKKQLPHQNFDLVQRTTLDQLEQNPMAQAVARRISNTQPELYITYGADAVLQAIADVTEGDTDWEEIGSSDVSAYVNYVKDALKDRMGGREEMADRPAFMEAATTEDVLSTVKKKLGDYLQDVATAIKKDPDLMAKLPQTTDDIKAVKTMKTADGHEIKITGNEDDGFRISIKNKNSNSKFANLDEAVMAVEMYCARRQQAVESADYIEEKR